MITLFSYLPELLKGLSITLTLMVSSITAGLFLALLFTLANFSRFRLIRSFINTLIFFVRGTPLLVQLFLIYYGAGQFAFIRDSSLWFILKEPMACAIIAISINTACYTTILFRGAINSVPKGEMLACEALGMSKWQALSRIIFPRAWRIALPAYSNEIIIILKSTSLASTITLLDVMGMTQRLITQTYDTIQLYVLAGIIYLSLNIILLSLFKFVTQRKTIAYS